MNKSHLGKADNPHGVVTPSDVGSFVAVKGVGKGILHYVGEIHGKEGIFCGIELDKPTGKHNGTFQGVVYFVCPPNHGIFAPIYRVELDEIDDVPMMTESQSNKSQERLSRSALATLNLRNVFKPEDPMQMSITSDVSLNMDASTFSAISWNDGDPMVASNTTFIVPPGTGHLHDTEDCDLMSIPTPKSIFNIDRDALRREEERILGASVVLEESKMGIENLPIVEDDDLETPLVESKVPITWKSPLPCEKSEIDPHNHQPLPISTSRELIFGVSTKATSDVNDLADNREDDSHLRSNSRQSIDTGYNGESDASRISTVELDNSAALKLQAPHQKELLAEREINPTVRAGKLNATKMSQKEIPRDVVQPQPRTLPLKPKTPSKHQLMMEQLKASIEAEKNRPKKAAKPRVYLLPPRSKVVTPQKENEDIKMGLDLTDTPKRTKQALKTVNVTPSKPPIERPKKERKPLYVAPPPKERKEVKTSTPQAVKERKPLELLNGIKNENGPVPKVEKAKVQFPTSSFAGKKHQQPAKQSSVSSVSIPGINKSTSEKKEIGNIEKLARLHIAVQAADVLSVVLYRTELQREHLESRLTKTLSLLASQSVLLEELRSRLANAEHRYQEDLDKIISHGEQVTRTHAETVERLKARLEEQLEDCSKEHERVLEDERSKHEAEVEAMSRRHQKVVASLDDKIAEAEKVAEQLKNDKKALQTALANDSDQRNLMLTKEINSLQTALEFKSSEMKELRQKYQQITLRVEEIPIKELEITKLKHKVTELKQALDQKLSYEKMLVHQNEELKKHQLAIEEEKDIMQRSFDVMVYKFETGEEADSLLNKQHTPAGKVQFRSRSSTSEHRSSTGIGARLSQSSFSDFERSADRDSLTRSTVSMYTSQYRLPENHADDIIYAPDEIITGRGSGTRLSASTSLDEERQAKKVNSTADPQTDSGIGI